MTENDRKATNRADSDPDQVKILIIQEAPVGWFKLRQLSATTGKVLASTIVGSMSGRRELLAALRPAVPGKADFETTGDDGDGLWLDYVADTGDGWDATTSVAWLVGRDRVWLATDGTPTEQPIPKDCMTEATRFTGSGTNAALPAGQILIFGGDQIYPTASAEGYESHLADPYKSARFFEDVDEVHARRLFAIPGNHDWYDGLTAFINQFCDSAAGRWIGAWKAQQKRSYFAIKLPHNWWLWGVDLALDDSLDPPQIEYFTNIAVGAMAEGDKVILCLPEPLWIGAHDPRAGFRPKAQQAWKKVVKLETLIGGAKARVALYLAGDQHHYTHYDFEPFNRFPRTPVQAVSPQETAVAQTETPGNPMPHFVTCGNGGAFLLGTKHLPDHLRFKTGTQAERKIAFPSVADSNLMRWGALLFPYTSWTFTAALALYQLLLIWVTNVASQTTAPIDRPAQIPSETWLSHLASTPLSLRLAWSDVFPHFLGILGNAPSVLILALIMPIACGAFTNSSLNPDTRSWPQIGVGVLHGLLHLSIGLLVAWWSVHLVFDIPALSPAGFWTWVLFAVAVLLLAYILDGLLFGAYLLFSNICLGSHEQEVFSCQAIEDYKGFLRMHLTEAGLEVFPIGLTHVAHSWKPAPGVAPGRRWSNPVVTKQVLYPHKHTLRLFDPVTPLKPHLIEPPFLIR